MDIDGVVFHLQLRARRLAPEERDNYPLHVRLGIHCDASFFDVLTDYFQTHMTHNKKPLKVAKRLVVAISNGASENTWAAKNGVIIDQSAKLANRNVIFKEQ